MKTFKTHPLDWLFTVDGKGVVVPSCTSGVLVEGTPCTRCGQCCKAEVCYIGQLLFDNPEPPCPALLYDGEKHACGAVMHSDQVWPGSSARFAEALGIGRGCDREMNKVVGPPEIVEGLRRLEDDILKGM